MRRLVCAAALVLVTGCGLAAEPEARVLTPSEAPTQVLDTSSATPQPPGEARERLYLVREGELVAVSRAAEEVTPRSALTDLLAGPTAEENERGLTTALPATAGASLVALEQGVAVVELQGDLTGSGRSDQLLALGQIVATLDSSPGVRAVRFVQDGEPLEVPGSDAALTGRPLTIEDYRPLIDS